MRSWTFSKVWFNSQNQVQSNLVDVFKGLESIITIDYIKRISLELSGSTPNARNDPKHGCLLCATRLASYTRIGHPVIGFSSQETLQFSLENPIFDPLDPKFVPKTCLLGYILLKTIKNITNVKSKHQFTSKSSLRSFFTKTLNFHANSQTTTPIQTPLTYNHV